MMLESWKEAVDKNKTFGALMTDLSKAFDCLSHELNYMPTELIYRL